MKTNIYTIAALVAFLVLFAIAIYIYRPNQHELTRITVVGDSQAKVAPDTAVISFSVVTQNKQAVDAQQENARKSEAVKQAIESIAATSKAEIKTSNYSLNPEQDYYSGKMPKILGYEVRNTVIVSLPDLNQVGAVVDAATKAGANSVDGIQFIVGEASPAQGDALALATKQAMAKAEAVAKSLNGRIVRVINASEGGVPIQNQPNLFDSSNASSMANMAFKSEPRTPIQAGSLNVRSQVVLVVEISV